MFSLEMELEFYVHELLNLTRGYDMLRHGARKTFDEMLGLKHRLEV